MLRGGVGAVSVMSMHLPRAEWPADVREAISPAVAHAACVRIGDDGVGLSAAAQLQLFDVRSAADETPGGVGLSVVDAIVRSYGGCISVRSEVEVGTEVSIYLPSAAAFSAVPNAAATILVVDDEESLRNVICRALNAEHYETVTAANGDEALHALVTHPEIDLVVMDLSMPQRDGLQVYEDLLEFYPNKRVILISGYSKKYLDSKLAQSLNPPPFLTKPFRSADLLHAVRAVLAAP